VLTQSILQQSRTTRPVSTSTNQQLPTTPISFPGQELANLGRAFLSSFNFYSGVAATYVKPATIYLLAIVFKRFEFPME